MPNLSKDLLAQIEKAFTSAFRDFEKLKRKVNSSSSEFETQLNSTVADLDHFQIQKANQLSSEAAEIVKLNLAKFYDSILRIRSCLERLKIAENAVRDFEAEVYLNQAIAIRENSDIENEHKVKFRLKATIRLELPDPGEDSMKEPASNKQRKSRKESNTKTKTGQMESNVAPK